MEIEALLTAARATIRECKYCVASTIGETGDANARVVQPSEPDADWHVWFLTDRRTRKVREVEANGRLTLTYQYDPEAGYVTLLGRANVINDVAAKRAIWKEDTYRWYPGGPEDPNVVQVDLETTRIELWNFKRDIMPGFSAAVLDRSGAGWSYSTT